MATDPLDFVVALLQSRAVRSKIVAGGGQWSIRKPRYTDPSFCVMLEGACWFRPEDGDASELREGDFLLLPDTPSFVLASDPALPPTDAPTDIEGGDAVYGDAAPTMRMLGGYFQFDRANAEFVARLLPPAIIIRRGEPGASRLGRLVELIAEEAGEHNRCRDLILERLVEVLLIEAWRFETEHASVEQGLLGGLADPALSGVLRAIHADLAGQWTVEKLARTAGMSRAVFAERFSRTVGIPPMQYLTEWRVARAKELLLGERPALSAIAGKVGYSSASAFSAAFARVVGCSPAEFAKRGDRGVGSGENASESVHLACHGGFLERFVAPRRVVVGPMFRPMCAALNPRAGCGDRVGELLSAVAQPIPQHFCGGRNMCVCHGIDATNPSGCTHRAQG